MAVGRLMSLLCCENHQCHCGSNCLNLGPNLVTGLLVHRYKMALKEKRNVAALYVVVVG